jgi:hypothetical protein
MTKSWQLVQCTEFKLLAVAYNHEAFSGVFVKLERGTWHAGPLFVGSAHADFYNLELSDTNVVDHNTHDYFKASAQPCEYMVLDDIGTQP